MMSQCKQELGVLRGSSRGFAIQGPSADPDGSFQANGQIKSKMIKQSLNKDLELSVVKCELQKLCFPVQLPGESGTKANFIAVMKKAIDLHVSGNASSQMKEHKGNKR